MDIPGMPVVRKWYRCPRCRKKLFVYDNTANCKGVYIRCKQCGKEVRVNI